MERPGAFLEGCAGRDDVSTAELVLFELYPSLRNPAVVERPLDSGEAAEVCQGLRRNPRWALVENAPVMEKVWAFAARPGVARRSVFDARISFTLLHHGVRRFATRNVADFEAFDFEAVWNPLTDLEPSGLEADLEAE